MKTTVLSIHVHPDVTNLSIAAELVSYLHGEAQKLLGERFSAAYLTEKVSALGLFSITLVDEDFVPLDENEVPKFCNIMIEPFQGTTH